MGKFSGIFKASIKNSIAYKFEMAITVLVAPASILVSYFLWKAIFAYSQVEYIGGYNFHQLITYFIFGWIVGIVTWTNVPDDLSHIIRYGQISKNLLKPMNFLLYYFFMDIGSRAFAMLVEAIPILIITFVFFKVQFSLSAFPFFILSLTLAFILNFLIAALVGMTAFWFVRNRGILKLKRVIVHFISGAVLPITFFPVWFQNLSVMLPFQYLVSVPINFWLGTYGFNEGLKLLIINVVWIIIFYILCVYVWNKAIKRVTSVGI
jgi:ABC-2 type transport system permease protein